MSRARDLADLGDGIDATQITSGQFDDNRIKVTNVTQHEGSIDALASNPTITLGSNATFPTGHVLRVFFDESDVAVHTFSSGTSVAWDELDVSIPAGASTSDYIIVALSINGIFNNTTAGRYLNIGLRYSASDWATHAQLGSPEFYDRPGWINITGAGIVVSSHIEARANHPTTSAYRIRPWIRAETGDMNVNQSNTRSTMTVYEIKG